MLSAYAAQSKQDRYLVTIVECKVIISSGEGERPERDGALGG